MSGKVQFASGNAIFFINFERFGLNTSTIVTFTQEFEISTGYYFIDFDHCTGLFWSISICVFKFFDAAAACTAITAGAAKPGAGYFKTGYFEEQEANQYECRW